MGLEEAFIKKIQVLEKGVLQNKQNANNIVKLMKLLDVCSISLLYIHLLLVYYHNYAYHLFSL